VALPTTSSTRIKANGLLFQLNTGSVATPLWKDFSYDCISFMVKSEDASNDQVTFYDASVGGGVDKYAEAELIQSLEATSLWQYLYSNPGKEMQFRYAPFGNTAITSTAPGFTGYLRLPRLLAPGIGGPASVDGTFSSETVRFDIVDETGSLLTQVTTGTWTRA
jgi:hypothetical protein